VDYLIKNDRFLTAGDHARIPAYERGQMARQVILFYSRLPEDIHRPFTRELFNDTSIKEVTVMLSEPENTDHLLSMMDEALASLPLDYEGYEQKVRILSQIHSYADGDFTIFPQHVVEPEPWSHSGQQLSFFDLVTAPPEQSMEESGEAEKEPSQETGQEAGEIDHGSADGIFVGTEEQEEPDKELSVENPVDQPIPLNGAIYIEGREFRIDNVDYDRGVVSLQDMTMAREARYPIFREEPLERVRTILREEGIKDQEDFQNHGEPDEHETAHEPVNFRITADDLGAGSPKAKFNANMEAIYLLKALDLTRPGGVVAVLTSSGTMDKQSESVREYLAGRADLLGAVRLPDNAFMRNANTRVVADILFFQKRDRAPLTLPDWVHLADTPEGYRVNSWFVEHPEMVLGTFAMESSQYGRQELTVKAFEGDLASRLAEAVRGIEGTIEEADLTDSEIDD
jgi:hypothetical protein